MYPYILKNTILHYLDKSAVLYGDLERYILNNVEVYMTEKIDGRKLKNEIIKEISQELESDEINRIENIFDEFIQSKSKLIKISDIPQKHVIKRTGSKGKNVPLNIIISLTNKCIMSCEHCFKSCSIDGSDSINYDVLMNTLRYLNGKSLTVQLTGGEPMIYDRFFDVLEYCSNNFETRVTTTAALINDKNVVCFKNAKMVQVSLYSNISKEHDIITNLKGSFDKTVKGIDNLVQAGIPVSIASIITKRNKNKIIDMINFALKHNVNQLSFGTLIPAGRGLSLKDKMCISKDEVKELTEIIGQLSDEYKDKIYIEKWKSDRENTNKMESHDCFDCGGGLFQWIINEHGNIKPCEFVPDEVYTIGCLEENKIEDILDKYSLDNLASKLREWDKKLNTYKSSVEEICPTIARYYKEKIV